MIERYNFETMAEVIEEWAKDGTSKDKQVVAEELGTSRVTLNRWIDRYWADEHKIFERYTGSDSNLGYINMWLDGMKVEDVIQHFSSAYWRTNTTTQDKNFPKPSVLIHDGFLMIPYYKCRNIYVKNWYQKYLEK